MFCQNDALFRESIWQNNSLVTHILFELQHIKIFSPVANFGNHPLDVVIVRVILIEIIIIHMKNIYVLFQINIRFGYFGYLSKIPLLILLDTF